ncbi:oligo-1,6-glucosidase [Planoprotostelium fungivorum]|uniref:Oligo-1,6-glucosidase n=1 Tax=Planoprotostelium fungivorum TaxID=1890364 RepID=A0A2P6N0D5_9EUKA|nr:oligo-1,6-glucosidase [Planoprotostelium fungivorum]
MSSETEQVKWWKELVVYQVYPRSYKDSNGDGVGDIGGLIQSLDYIQSLGVDAIWLSPVYPSPNEDNGYDISDYCDIQPEFGTMQQWETFLAESHRRGLKVVMDIVVNHTSDQHNWFKEARKSKDNPYHDYYIWRTAEEGKLPNNWQSFFSGTVWQYNEATSEYYLHLFAKGQPDLNWENPKVREEVKKVIEFWAKKGVDGFRLDVINVISKTPGLPDASIKNPSDMFHWAGEHFFNGPKFIEWMTDVRKNVFDRYKVFTVGETPGVTPAHGKQYTHSVDGVVNMIFQFELVGIDQKPDGSKFDHVPAKLEDVKRVTNKWQLEIGRDGWNSNYLENHDQPRSVSRYGRDVGEERILSAKMLAAWYLFLKGTPYIYQGQEIGMTNVVFPSIKDYNDVETLNYYKEAREMGREEGDLMYGIRNKSRDNARTPMQWNASNHAGFTSGESSWLSVNPNYTEINVASAESDSNSILHFYRKILTLRKENKVAIYGDYNIIAEEHPQVFAYTRTSEEKQLLVCANFSDREAAVEFGEGQNLYGGAEKVLLDNYSHASPSQIRKGLKMKPYQVVVAIYDK